MRPEPSAADVGRAASYFVRRSERVLTATHRTSGAWTTSEQHISPLCGLAVHEIERHVAASTGRAGDGRRIGRVSFDILGPVAVGDVEVDVVVVRPGRTVELVEAVVSARGREVLRARAWRMATFDTAEVAGGAPDRIPAPDELPEWDMTRVWPGDFIGSLRVRRSPASRPGRGTAWVSTDLPLVADEPVSALAAYVALVDTTNGAAVREAPDEWLFPNLDLTVHLHRTPVAGPVGMDVHVTFGADGLGVTSAVLHDAEGPVGRAAQSLTVRRRPRREG
ncbi:thioesterase family protein [Actinotalea ferrariae]|uniref:thioesterase family protein n=1 Tax=Actinotalea ferrariae TaxID=1386098 RepID=UPI001EBBB6D3|nr:thioesterase family protein [Actinotalea ferrariae]MBX9244782.1 thioesterase family protein [Actinotalea ferrariae]